MTMNLWRLVLPSWLAVAHGGHLGLGLVGGECNGTRLAFIRPTNCAYSIVESFEGRRWHPNPYQRLLSLTRIRYGAT